MWDHLLVTTPLQGVTPTGQGPYLRGDTQLELRQLSCHVAGSPLLKPEPATDQSHGVTSSGEGLGSRSSSLVSLHAGELDGAAPVQELPGLSGGYGEPGWVDELER